MAKYRKKPVVIEAVQWTGNNPEAISEFCGDFVSWPEGNPQFATLEGDLYAREGDWIIKGVKGEFYPCKPDIFAATYEAVE
jgi:hypothetical protein